MLVARMICVLAATLLMSANGDAQAPANQPVFSGAGLRAKIVSLAVTKDNQALTMATILENASDNDVVVAMVVEQPRALDNRGNTFIGDVNGIATCQLGGRVTVDQCLDVGGRFGLALERYTLIEKGKAVTATFVFRRGGDRAQLTQPLGDMITFSAQLAVRASGGEALGGSKNIGPPRMVSIGIPLIPLPAQQ